jgi:hypothetical protein
MLPFRSNVMPNAIPWTADIESALKQAREQQRNVLLDFTAAPM